MKPAIKFYALLLIASLTCMSQICAQRMQKSTLGDGRDWDWYDRVCFPDAITGIAVGGNSTNSPAFTSVIMRTEDGGASWNREMQYSYNGIELMDICFSDPMNGWTVGNGNKVLNTKDGGKTWTQKGGPPWGTFYSVFCIDSISVWVGSYDTLIYHTTDGGKTWITQRNALRNTTWDIFFFNADTGIAVGGWSAYWGENLLKELSFIIRTTNGGDTWNLVENDTNIMGYYEVFFTNDTNGYVVGTGGTIKRTIDGGQTWTKQTSGTTTDLWCTYFVNADYGFAAGGNVNGGFGGIMLHTTDGGTTWTKQDIPLSKKALYGIYFTDENIGTAVGAWGNIISTTSGGESWTEHIWPASSIVSNEILTGQNFPNPFSRSTTIRFEVPEAGNVTLKIYSLDGKIIATLVDKEMVPGTYEVTWDAGDLPAGVYFCRIEAGSSAESRKLVMQK